MTEAEEQAIQLSIRRDRPLGSGRVAGGWWLVAGAECPSAEPLADETGAFCPRHPSVQQVAPIKPEGDSAHSATPDG